MQDFLPSKLDFLIMIMIHLFIVCAGTILCALKCSCQLFLYPCELDGCNTFSDKDPED